MLEKEEDCECTGKVALKEELAQFKYENKRLKEELDTLRRNSFGIEENLVSISDDLKKKDSVLKRYEQKVTSFIQVIKEKDNINDVLERKIEEVIATNRKLEISLAKMKAEKDELTEQNEILLVREKGLKEKCNKIETDLSELQQEFNMLTEKSDIDGTLLDELRRQIKILEDEKMTHHSKLFYDKFEIGSPLQRSPASVFSIGSSPRQRCLDFHLQIQNNSFDLGCNELNLKEELLTARIISFLEGIVQTMQEQQFSVDNLEEKLRNSDRAVVGLSLSLLERLKEAIDVIILFQDNAGAGFELKYPPLEPNFEKLVGLFQKWSDGQSGENNPLTEALDSVKAKEVVINAQPVPNRTVECISIATQTDRILLARAFEDFGPIHNILDHKYNDVDMDLYRSYRKLSILPEEEDDETFKRIPSLKNAINSKTLSAKLPESYKTHSADDILNFDKRTVKLLPSEKLISSCTNIIFSGPENAPDGHVRRSEFVEDSSRHDGDFPMICDNKLSDNSNLKSEQKSISNSNTLHLEPLDPAEALRQPHSFDSYLDPQQIPVIPLPRQISDPTQNTALDPPFTRRGSYLKRPRSTCRPLRLPYEENAIKNEERVSKVRFDLSSNANSKSSDNTNGSKGPMPVSNLKNHRKVEKISRFTVERVDEDEFRKLIDESSKATNRKRPPLIHSVVYKKSVLHDITFYDPESSIGSADGPTSKVNATASLDSPYDTATENSPADSFDLANYESNYLMADVYSSKRRKQSDSSSYSVESQDSIDGNDILVKSIRLHTNGEYITMRELDRESSTSSHLSADMDIPYIDAEELPVIKPSPEVIKRSFSEAKDDGPEAEEFDDGSAGLGSRPRETDPAINQSDSSETFVTACSDVTPTSDVPDACLSPPKSSGLSKSPTVLKNLSNFELYNTVSDSITSLSQNKRASLSVRNQTLEEEDESFANEFSPKPDGDRDEEEEEESTILKLTSSDGSEMSDTVTYVTVRSDPSNVLLSSDCDSDTYVTIQSDKSPLERKCSDFSENSSSPYNTPPDTSSASFCTPPDTYSPILSRLAKRLSAEGDSPRSQTRSSSPYRNLEQTSPGEYHSFRMSNRSTEVGEDQESNNSGEACSSSYSPAENATEEHQTIHGNVQTKNLENNSTFKHTGDELDNLVAVQSDLDVEALNVDHINEVVSNIDAGIVVLVDGKTTLSEEEVEKKFQEISLAFRTDMMMLQKRLIIRKRLKDQAELNLEKEIDLMKTKINNLRYLCCDSDSLEQLSDLRKHLDIVLASANYLSGSSEAYGFVQNEEKMSGAVSVIIKKIDSIERMQEEMSKSPNVEKPENKRIQLLSILDDDRHEERMLRRRSVASLAINGHTKRRASIASVPRNSLPSEDISGSQCSSYSSIAPNRNSGTVAKKISSGQTSSSKPISPLAAGDQTSTRSKKESRIGEDKYGMKFVQDYDKHIISDDSYDILHSSDEEMSNDESDMKSEMPLAVLMMSGSFGNRMRTNSAASETPNIIDSLRKVVKWNVILVRNSRFQCPENIRQYVPFFITWYVVILVGAIFTSGFFTGFNRCFNSQLLCTYSTVSGIVTFWITVISMVLKCIPMKFTLVTALMTYLYSLHYSLQEEGIDAWIRRLGIEFEIIYTSGAPI